MIGDRTVTLELAPNPSHLEVVNPVMSGMARAHQRVAGSAADRDERLVLPLCIHGDAAFPGEGVVPETFNLSRLRGYRVGGTIHGKYGILTTVRILSRSEREVDLAEGIELPHQVPDPLEERRPVISQLCQFRIEDHERLPYLLDAARQHLPQGYTHYTRPLHPR